MELLAINTLAQVYKIAGGPEGGTFIIYSKIISSIGSGRNINIESVSSFGSIDNVKKVEKNEVQFAIAYSGHVYQALKGLLRGDSRQYHNIMAVGYLYGAAAQLAVKVDKEISSVEQLKGLKIGMGNQGSGAADTAELFFREMDMWNHITPYYQSYQKIVDEFIQGNVNAFWLFTSFPNPSITFASQKSTITLLNTYNALDKRNIFSKYPYYTECSIPENTYHQVKKEIKTFQDSALLIAHKSVPSKIVAKLSYFIYSPKGLAMFKKSPYVSEKLTAKKGLKGVVTTLHPGAIAFWKKKGLLK